MLQEPPSTLETEVLRDAIRSLEVALGVWGGGGRGDREAWGGDYLRQARRLLQAPSAESAASALLMIGEVSRSCDSEATGIVKAAERAARDVVVVRCRSQQLDPANRVEFLSVAERAFGVSDEGLDREVAACLLVAFYKLGRRPLE